MERNDRTWYWCSKDCHYRRPVWCHQKNCMSRSDYKEHMQKQNAEKEKKSNEDFKVALSALVTEEDFKMLEEQFLK
eukprot:5802573-Ditylum_brightwellii.AAC.1